MDENSKNQKYHKDISRAWQKFLDTAKKLGYRPAVGYTATSFYLRSDKFSKSDITGLFKAELPKNYK